jgi:hypothetical protein
MPKPSMTGREFFLAWVGGFATLAVSAILGVCVIRLCILIWRL